MDLVLPLTLIIMQQVTSFVCNPLYELRNEDKVPFDSSATVDLFHDTQYGVKNAGLDQDILKDKKNVLHMIQLVRKDGSKAPVAIILTPTDIATDIANKYDRGKHHEAKHTENDVPENIMKSNEISVDKNFRNGKDAHIIEKSIDLEKIKKNVVSLDTPGPKQQLIDQLAEDANKPIHNLNNNTQIKEDAIKTENTFENKSSTDGDDYDLSNTSNNRESLQIVANEDDLYDNMYFEKEGTQNNHDKKAIDNGKYYYITDEKRSSATEELLNLVKSIKDSNVNFDFRDTNSTLHDEIVSEKPISAKLTKQNDISDELNLIRNITTNDDVFEKNVTRKYFTSNINEIGHPTIFVDGEKINEMNNGHEKVTKASTKDTDKKLDTRTYHLLFVFNR